MIRSLCRIISGKNWRFSQQYKYYITNSNQIMIQGDNYSWPGVLEFLHKQYQNQALNQNIWFIQKKTLNEQIKQLEARVTALENINSDLINRNRMLEYCLRQMKGQKQQIKPDLQLNQPKMPQRRSKPNKNHINKILQSLGIKNLIENIQKDVELRGPGQGPKIDQKITTNRDKQKSLNTIKSSAYKDLGPLNPANGHQDGVRDLAFIPDKDILVSASQDCTMKLWSIKNPSQFSCIGTIRDHAGPIFTLTQGQNFLFSGGMQGIIRVWDFQNVTQKKDLTKKNCKGVWNNSEDDKLEPIWQLLYSQQYKTLFSTSSQVAIKAYSLQKEEGGVTGKYKKSYCYENSKQPLKDDEQIPTSICIHNGFLVAGYVTSHSLAHFDLQSGKIALDLKLSTVGQVSTNKIVSHPNLLMGAFEDKMVRFFDKGKMTYAFKAHDDSVTSIATTANINEFFTSGHDGFVKLWDLRKLEPITSFNSHSKKYDQSVHCIATSSNYKAASGGADSIIKIYSTS